MLSVFTLSLWLAISANRFYAIYYPVSYHVNKNAGYSKAIILVCIIVGVLIGSLPGLGWRNDQINSCQVFNILSFGFMIGCCCFIICVAFIIIVLYILTYSAITDHVSVF